MPIKGETLSKMSPVEQRRSISAAMVDAIDSEKMFPTDPVDRLTFSEQTKPRNRNKISVERSTTAMVSNTVLKVKQRPPIKQRKVDSTKRKVAILRPTITISRTTDAILTDQYLFDENANQRVFISEKLSALTPKKMRSSDALFFGQKSPQLSPFKGRAFSPSNVNKPRKLSVTEMVEGWPFKRPMTTNAYQTPINDKIFNCRRSYENNVDAAKCSEASIPIQSNAQVNKENVPSNAVSDERYPKSMYVSPFTIVARRPIRRKP